MVAALVAVVAVKIGALALDWRRYEADFAAYRQVIREIPASSVVAYVNLANPDRLDPTPRCEMYGPLLIPLRGDATPVFASETAQPMALAGRLAAANRMPALPPEQAHGLPKALAYFSAMSRAGLYDYVLACDPAGLSASIPGDHVLVGQAGRFRLYQLRASTASSAGRL
jgi:hypothetical protein